MRCRIFFCTAIRWILGKASGVWPPLSSRSWGNKIKCLYWEDNGFVLYYKSLAEEKFRWPRRGDEIVSLSAEQINWLLDGYDISLMKGHKKLRYDSVF
jgi:hypothetical protein